MRAWRQLVVAVLAVGAGISLFAAISGCSSGPPEFKELPVRVVVTTTIIADMVQRVGGDRVEVTTLMGPGVDPHRYQPTAGDREKIDRAHLVFFNGLHLEGKMIDVFEKSRGRIRGYAVTDGIERSQLRHVDRDGGEYDPHVWFNVRLWARCVPVVRDALATLDPGGQELYEANATAYIKELEKLDAEIRDELAKIPRERRKLVTSHDAFAYFGAEYGFEVKGLQGVSTASETSTKDRTELAKYLGENQIPVVFTETSVPDEGLKAVLDTSARDHKHRVRLSDEPLFSDALGEPNTPEGTYPGMIRHNVRVIVQALSR